MCLIDQKGKFQVPYINKYKASCIIQLADLYANNKAEILKVKVILLVFTPSHIAIWHVNSESTHLEQSV